MVRNLSWAIVLALLVGPGMAYSSGERKKEGSGSGYRPAIGEIELRSPAGEEISLVPYIGRKSVVVVFWAAWCPICREEVPRLNKLHADANIKVIGVNEGDSLQKIQSFAAATNMAYQIVLDPVARVAKAFGVPGMPYCVIIGRTGTIVYRGSGLPENLDYYLKQ
jgi:peroxiredoxin